MRSFRRGELTFSVTDDGPPDAAVVVCLHGFPQGPEAFAACAQLVDRVKAEVPIWKLQRFADGGEEWVGSL